MLTAGPLALGRPVTHRDLFTAAQLVGPGRRVCVQARRYNKAGGFYFWLCAEVLEIGTGDAEWFRVRTAIDEWWANGRDLRLCSPTGRCQCDDEPAALQATGRTASATARPTEQKAQQPRGFQRGCAVQPPAQPTR